MAENESPKRRRSAAEVAAANDLDQKSKSRVPDPQKFRQAKAYSDAAAKSPWFEDNYHKSSIDGLSIHHFHQRGETLVGIIGEWEGESHGPSSARFKLDDGRVIRVPGNRRLLIAVRKADAMYQRVKITYLGKKNQKTGGHYEKVYLVEAAPLGKEPIARKATVQS